MATGGDHKASTIGLLHPGAMGAAIGAALRARGHRVVWASAGRSLASAQRATAAGLEDLSRIEALAAQSDVILSVIPPAEALAVASAVTSFDGIYVDANATAPETARAVARQLEAAGGRFVDGSIIGGPPAAPGDVRVYLSGDEAAAVGALFDGTIVDARVLSASIGDASAVKMAYAGWTKGAAALLLTLREYAGREGVEDAVLNELARPIPDLSNQLARAASSLASKGWRWQGEMREIAAALDASGLPAGFHEAAAEVYARSERPAPDVDESSRSRTQAVKA